ncbi:MAG: hypothetical protein K8U57_27325 [Planctomycetes bacterium]|nr:hypothetical protein [Planctomycetota bacterium]
MENWDWGGILTCAFFLSIIGAVIFRMWEITVWSRQAIHEMRERRHARQLEVLDKQIALEKAKQPEVPPCVPNP